MIEYINGNYKITIEKHYNHILLHFHQRSTLSPYYWYEANKPTIVMTSFIIYDSDIIAIDVLQKSEYFNYVYEPDNKKYIFTLNNNIKLLLI